MGRMNISEFELIRQIVKQIPKVLRESAQLRDDTAVLYPAGKGRRQLLTTDAIVENVDFRIHQARPEEIGKKALAVNLSDIAAMGGTPECFTVALGIPSYIDAEWIKRFYNGLLVWARHFNVVCAGGDISRAACFFASVTVLGTASSKPVLRRGARPGDWIGVTGQLGGSQNGHHLHFKPRVEEGRFLADKSIHAMIDISDGLAQDLAHLLSQSQVSCELEKTAIPIATTRLKKGNSQQSNGTLISALTDGEDFELLFMASSKVKNKIVRCWREQFPQTQLSWIGRVIPPIRYWRWLNKGQPCAPLKLKRKGYQHFE